MAWSDGGWRLQDGDREMNTLMRTSGTILFCSFISMESTVTNRKQATEGFYKRYEGRTEGQGDTQSRAILSGRNEKLLCQKGVQSQSFRTIKMQSVRPSCAELRYTGDWYLYQFHILHHVTWPLRRIDLSVNLAKSRSPVVRFISK